MNSLVAQSSCLRSYRKEDITCGPLSYCMLEKSTSTSTATNVVSGMIVRPPRAYNSSIEYDGKEVTCGSNHQLTYLNLRYNSVFPRLWDISGAGVVLMNFGESIECWCNRKFDD